MSNIDMTKTYTTRDGQEVHLYEERKGYIYGRYCDPHLDRELDCWTPASWDAYGICNQNIGTDLDLVPVKTWRAWKEGEAPAAFMVRHKKSGHTAVGYGRESQLCLDARFELYYRLHADGTETPCGVLEG